MNRQRNIPGWHASADVTDLTSLFNLNNNFNKGPFVLFHLYNYFRS